MNEVMIESFFKDLSEYTRFVLEMKEELRATSDGSCIASLKKEDGKFLYALQWKNGYSVGEYVRPFSPTEENFRLFKAGCAEAARRLRILLATHDVKQVPDKPPAFGILACDQ